MRLLNRVWPAMLVVALLILSACDEGTTATPAAIRPTTSVPALATSTVPAPTTTTTASPPPATSTTAPTQTAIPTPTGTASPVPPTATASPTPSISGDPTLTGTLTLWHGWSGSSAAALAKGVVLFNSFYPNVKVTLEQIRIDQLDTRFTSEAATDTGPDLLLGQVDWLAPYADAGLILPLDDEIATLRAKLLPAAVAALTYKGKLFAAPATFDTVALFYNKKLVANAPRTTAELLQAAGGEHMALVANFNQNAGWLSAFGGSLFDAKSCSAFGDAGGAAFLDFLKRLAATPGVNTQEGDQALGPDFAAAKYGLIANGSWAIGDYRAALGADLAAAPLPAGPAGPAAPFLEATPLMINASRSAEQHKLAATFLRFYLSIENQTLMMTEAGQLPSNLTVNAASDPVIAGFMAQAQTALPVPLSPEMDAVWTALDDAIRAVTTASADPAQAAQAAAAAINAANGKKCQ